MTNKQALMIAASIALAGIVHATAQTAPSTVTGCQYIAAGVTLANLQTSPLLCDVNGRLKVTTTP